MRIDSHQHFWHYNKAEYGWIPEDMSNLRQSFLPEDLGPLLKSLDFEGTVAVQARQSLDETEFLLNLAEQNSIVRGVVGWVDLCSAEAYSQLEKYANNPFLKGIRHIVQDEPDDRFMLREDFQKGIGLLKEFGLTYDLLVYPKQIPSAIELVEQFPDQPFVLDHIGKPDIKNGVLNPWKEDIQKLAAFENVSCKVSGMVTEADLANWKTSDFTPYLDVVFEAFGSDRIMIGSDWPVCTASRDYLTVMEIVMKYLEQLSPEAQEKVLGRNCVKFYGL